MRQFMRKEGLEIRVNTQFDAVIRQCEQIRRKGQQGTWITYDMRNAYTELHRLGKVHSIETYLHGKLVGGLYGVQAGEVFCGESMFSLVPNASKAALIWLCTHSIYTLIDCQVHTDHLERMGARFISRDAYMRFLDKE